jgi:hypothetical protein
MVLQRTSLPLEGALVLRDRQGLTFYIQVYIQVPRVINVAQRTCVQYLRRSSVRRAGDRLFIAAQFVTARSGDHLWADGSTGISERARFNRRARAFPEYHRTGCKFGRSLLWGMGDRQRDAEALRR